MPKYDADNFDPPAPVAYVTLRDPATGASFWMLYLSPLMARAASGMNTNVDHPLEVNRAGWTACPVFMIESPSNNRSPSTNKWLQKRKATGARHLHSPAPTNRGGVRLPDTFPSGTVRCKCRDGACMLFQIMSNLFRKKRFGDWNDQKIAWGLVVRLSGSAGVQPSPNAPGIVFVHKKPLADLGRVKWSKRESSSDELPFL